MDSIVSHVLQHITLNEDEQYLFISLLEEKKLKRKQFFLHEGQVCKHLGFVVSGCLRSYIIDKNGIEHILQFAPAHWWIADVHSFITQQCATLHIDTLIDTTVYLLSHENQTILFEKIPQFERYFRVIAERALAASHKRLLGNLSLSAQERYDNFCTLYPSMVHVLPQKQIAAYIGVTPEFLSKLRTLSYLQKKS